MDLLEHENQVLREEMTAMRAETEKLTNMVNLLATTQIPTPPPPPFNSQAQTFVIVIPISSESVNTPRYTMPWSMPSIFGERSCPYVSEVYYTVCRFCSSAWCNKASSHRDLFSSVYSHRPSRRQIHLPFRECGGL